MRVVVRHSVKSAKQPCFFFFHSFSHAHHALYFFLSNFLHTHTLNQIYIYTHISTVTIAAVNSPPPPPLSPCFALLLFLLFSISYDFHLTFTQIHTLILFRVVVFSYVCGNQSGISNWCRISTRPSSIFQCFTVALN